MITNTYMSTAYMKSILRFEPQIPSIDCALTVHDCAFANYGNIQLCIHFRVTVHPCAALVAARSNQSCGFATQFWGTKRLARLCTLVLGTVFDGLVSYVLTAATVHYYNGLVETALEGTAQF